jgi:processive 1,2-diacylglycerol beta-glucosyltransferase
MSRPVSLRRNPAHHSRSNGNGVNGHWSTYERFRIRLERPPRVLILSASVGSGHMRAAEAVELALKRLVPDAFVRNIDVLTMATAPFRHCYGHIYLDLIDAAPAVLGFFYNLMDRPRPPLADGWEELRVKLEKMSIRPLQHLLTSEPWDLVINTHFLPEEIIAWLRRNHRLSIPQVLVTTDFETHRLWVHQPCEHYFTATEEAAEYLKCYGVPRKDATATGIPIHPSFAEPKNRAACLARHGLVGDRPIVLQLNGGFGVGPIEELYRALLDMPNPVDLVVVTGRNEKAKRHLTGIPAPPRHRVKVLGFTRAMDALMAVADLIVTKPGGLTTSEALASGTPLVVVHPVPGQEERNSDYILENGAAIKVNHMPTLGCKVAAVLRDPARLASMKTHARALGRPYAAYEVVARSLALLQRNEHVLPLRNGHTLAWSEQYVGASNLHGGRGGRPHPAAVLGPNVV